MTCKKTHSLSAALVLAALVLVFPADAGNGPKGRVDWPAGHIRGVGYGTARPSGNRFRDQTMAIRAAEVQAQRALAETIHGVRIDGVTTIRDAMKESAVNSRVQGIIHGARKVRERVSWDGATPMAEVELRICIVQDAPECRGAGSLMEALPVAQRREPSYVPAVTFEPAPGGATPGASDPTFNKHIVTVSYDSSQPVTGLLLEAEGLRFERELFPVVVTRKGGSLQTVFSAKQVLPEVIRTHGVARYADSVDQARGNPRLGDNPLVIPVAEVTRENLLVIQVEGAKAVRETTRYGNNYLAEAKVIIAGR